MKKISVLSFLYILVIVGLFLYSYTQVDLSLTLSKASFLQTIEKSFQYIGYFNRSLSTYLFLSILFFLFGFYLFFLKLASQNRITRKQLWLIIILMTVILTFSYNAFSYDLFNYIFDAKIFTHYHLNPYQYKALDFAHDPMLSFMHWVERTYPYGPAWLGLTIPLSFLGLNYFLPTFFLFKIMISLSFLGTIYFTEKIMSKLNYQNTIFGLVLLALNPLIIIESLVSSHLDINMMCFAMWGFSTLLSRKYYRSLLMFITSVLVKFATGFITLVYLFVFYSLKMGKKLNWDLLWGSAIVLMLVTVVVASLRTNFQPWYILPVIPFTALLAKKYYVVISVLFVSLFSLLQYVPFLYLGNWDKPVPTILMWLTIAGISLSVLVSLLWKIKIAFKR